jgi:hypothetical protein
VSARQLGHQHIAVGDDDPLVAGGAPAFEHIIEFGIRAHALVADEHSGVRAGVFGYQVFDKRQDGITRGSDAKQDFVVRIIEFEGRPQRLGSIIVYPAQRAHQADRRISAGVRRLPRITAQAANRDHNARGMNKCDGDAKECCGKNRRYHRAEQYRRAVTAL